MCIIIVKPAGQALSKWVLKNSWENNGDGSGFVYARDGKLVIVKELHKFKRFWRIYQSHGLDQDNVVLHFRIGTSGHHNLDNTHPFLIDDNHALAHNGILDCVKVPPNSNVNDTQIFINEYLKCMIQADGEKVDWVNNRLAREYAEEAMGKSNKMAVINGKGEIGIWNENGGHWHSLCWFSNRSYEDRSYRAYYGGHYKTKWKSTYLTEWEQKWNGVNDTGLYAQDCGDRGYTNKRAWPESEDAKEIPFDPTDMSEGGSQQCLECGVLLSTSEINASYGCCEDCVQRAFEGA